MVRHATSDGAARRTGLAAIVPWVAVVLALSVGAEAAHGEETDAPSTPAVGAPPSAPADDAAAATSEIMRGILDAISHVLPSSLDPADFAAPEHLGRNLTDLEVLARNAQLLSRHGRASDESFAFLSRTLARDALEVHRRYEHGRFEEARFLLFQIVDDCVACHTRLPASDGLPKAEAFVGALDTGALEPAARLRLLLATRQFEAALDLVEALAVDPEQSPAMLEFRGFLTEYLTTAIRVKGETERAASMLRGLARRPDTPRYLARDAEVWIAALAEQTGAPSPVPSIAHARALIERGRAVNLYPLDRRGLVYFLLASSDLHRVLTETHGGTASAEALYLLGVSVSHLSLSQWPREAESYLTEAIRADPGGPFAADAFALLEERTLAGYSGSGGPHLPGDVERELDELQQLIDASAPRTDG